MWRLTIEQKRKSEYANGFITEKIEFYGSTINDATAMILMLAGKENNIETTYKLEKVEGEEA